VGDLGELLKVCSSQVKLYLGRGAPSAIGWYQKRPCVSYDYSIKILNMYKTLKADKRESLKIQMDHKFKIKKKMGTKSHK